MEGDTQLEVSEDKDVNCFHPNSWDPEFSLEFQAKTPEVKRKLVIEKMHMAWGDSSKGFLPSE